MSVRENAVSDRPAVNCRVRRSITVLVATAAPTVLWIAAGPLSGNDLTVHQAGGDQTVGVGAVIAVSLLAGLAGWASLAAVERFTRMGRRLWIPLAATALISSLFGPLGSGVGAVSVLALLGMHLLVGITLILGLPRPASC